MPEQPSSGKAAKRWDALALRVAGFALRHPSRFTYVVAEALRPLPWRQRARNAGFHLRHWNDVDAWRKFLSDGGLDDSCT